MSQFLTRGEVTLQQLNSNNEGWRDRERDHNWQKLWAGSSFKLGLDNFMTILLGTKKGHFIVWKGSWFWLGLFIAPKCVKSQNQLSFHTKRYWIEGTFYWPKNSKKGYYLSYTFYMISSTLFTIFRPIKSTLYSIFYKEKMAEKVPNWIIYLKPIEKW